MNYNDIIARIEQCKPLIKNWVVMEGIDFDYLNVQIDGILIDKQPNEKYEKWEISLLTTMHTRFGTDGWDVYSVQWRFRDLWGNDAFFSLRGYQLTGTLSLDYIDYDDFAVVGFSIVQPDGSSIFKFDEPDEVSVVSIKYTKHQDVRDIYQHEMMNEENIMENA